MGQDERDEEAAYEQRVRNITKNIGVKYIGNEEEEQKETETQKEKELDELLAEYKDHKEKLNQMIQEQEKSSGKEKDDEVFNPTKSPVYLNWKAYKRILGYSLRYASEKIDQKEWREVYGICIGYIEDNKRLIVTDAIPMCVGEDNTFVRFSNLHYVDFAQFDEVIFQRSIQDKKNEFAVGWWHSHPGHGHFLSATDIETQIFYQNSYNPFGIALEFDHSERKDDNLGIKALRLENPDLGYESDFIEVELRYFIDKDKDLYNKIEGTIEKMKLKMPEVLEALEHIDKIILKKEIPSLQKKFNLLLPSGKDRDDEEDYQLEEISYIWSQETLSTTKGAPKFRAKIEAEIKQCDEILKKLKEKNEMDKYNEKRREFTSKIQALIDKPYDILYKLMEHFGSVYEKISPFRDFLDANERKKLEHFEEWIYGYFRVLDNLKYSLAIL
ncbi:MAG: Mov34/MPN/PAD-1 family protein [Promethearchaeota archaeon]